MESKIITIKNDVLEVSISTLGAELQSIKKNDDEFLWNGDPEIWKGRAPIMFPICGGLKEDKYTFNGKEYSITKHGYAKLSIFEVDRISENKAKFILKSNEESKKMFPFDYIFEVTYTLNENKLDVEYAVKNLGDDTMYFSFGGHEGYMCKEGIEEYSLCFEKKERLTSNNLHGNLLSNDILLLGEEIDELPLKYEYFDIDALTLLNLKSRSVTLKHKSGKARLKIDFDGFDYMFVWTMAKKYGKYICIEPWAGIPDFEGTSYDIKEKVGINKLQAKGTFKRVHTITIEP